jgi:cytochrome P450
MVFSYLKGPTRLREPGSSTSDPSAQRVYARIVAACPQVLVTEPHAHRARRPLVARQPLDAALAHLVTRAQQHAEEYPAEHDPGPPSDVP